MMSNTLNSLLQDKISALEISVACGEDDYNFLLSEGNINEELNCVRLKLRYTKDEKALLKLYLAYMNDY